MCCPQLCSHCGWLLLKCSAIGIGFNGAETNCRIAHILGILLMNSCNTDIFFSTYYHLQSVRFELFHRIFMKALIRVPPGPTEFKSKLSQTFVWTRAS